MDGIMLKSETMRGIGHPVQWHPCPKFGDFLCSSKSNHEIGPMSVAHSLFRDAEGKEGEAAWMRVKIAADKA
jgi:hypothetical protein